MKTIIRNLVPTTHRHARAASRLALGIWLPRHGLITVSQNTKLSHGFQPNKSHKQMFSVILVGLLSRPVSYACLHQLGQVCFAPMRKRQY